MKAVPRRNPWILALLAAVLILVGAPARAQFAMGGMDPSQFSSPVSTRALADYATILALTPEQKDALKSLHEGYTTAHAELGKDMKKAMQDAQEKVAETQDWKAFQKDMMKVMKPLTERGEKLEKGFYDDLKSLLDARQQERWGRLERHRRREKGLRFGFISGQSVDLDKVLATLKIDPATVPGLEAELDQYEAAMDRSLQAFEKFGKDQQAKSEALAEDFDMSKIQEMMAKAKEMMTEMLGYAKAMRDVNRQYARTITPLLPEETRPKFQAEIDRRAHPRIYRQSWVNKAIAAAEGFNDVTPEQKATLATIKADYQRDVPALNKRWAAAMEAQEEKTGGQMMEMMSMMGPADGSAAKVKEDTNKARGDRKDLDKRTKEKLLALLNEDQKGRLPEEQKDQGMYGFTPDFMGAPDEDEPGK